METLFRVVCSSFPPIPHRSLPIRNPSVSALRTSPSPLSEVAEEDVLQTFFKERRMNGDFVSRLSDVFWQRELSDVIEEGDDDVGEINDTSIRSETDDQAMQNDSERRKKLNLLQYEAIQRELMLLSIGIGTACTGYCFVTLSFQGAISYATGVLFSCLYLKLLYRHVDNISREAVPQIFRQKKSKKIGIRNQDLEDSLEKLIKGCGMALSSPRLVLPAAIYGLWILSHQYLSSDLFDFQLVPAMVGLFVYKAAALVQVYRDNEDLQLIFPDDL